MTITIRNAGAGDKDRCLALLGALSDATGSSISAGAGEVFDLLLDEARGLMLVAEDEAGTVLGLASLTFNPAMRYGGEYCQLEELVVDPAARGRNLGALLVEATIERARERGCAEYGLYLVASTEKNWPFYEKFGFERVGTELRQLL